mmetsp:Transcript_15923/g.32683  ORF Transcript_15923/g.32683 Transcript_15923/m.32683 type:complete len:287 (+) Transcript_15923:1818-2678(+)
MSSFPSTTDECSTILPSLVRRQPNVFSFSPLTEAANETGERDLRFTISAIPTGVKISSALDSLASLSRASALPPLSSTSDTSSWPASLQQRITSPESSNRIFPASLGELAPLDRVCFSGNLIMNSLISRLKSVGSVGQSRGVNLFLDGSHVRQTNSSSSSNTRSFRGRSTPNKTLHFRTISRASIVSRWYETKISLFRSIKIPLVTLFGSSLGLYNHRTLTVGPSSSTSSTSSLILPVYDSMSSATHNPSSGPSMRTNSPSSKCTTWGAAEGDRPSFVFLHQDFKT